MLKLLLFIILITLYSCSNNEIVKFEVNNNLKEEHKDSLLLKPFIEYDSLGRLLGEVFFK